MNKLAFQIDGKVIELAPDELKALIKKGQSYDHLPDSVKASGEHRAAVLDIVKISAEGNAKLAEHLSLISERMVAMDKLNKDREERLNKVLFEDTESDADEFAADIVNQLTPRS